MLTLPVLLIIAPPILLALTFHEYAHAWTAYRLGDPTAKQMGRLTLNPLAHLDLMGTIMVFIVHFGWARPVPVNPAYFRDPKKDLLWVSAAGPASNVFMALIFGLLIRVLNITDSSGFTLTPYGILQMMLVYGMIINLMLAFFNILPIPPLDGSKIMMGLVPPAWEASLHRFMQYGHFVLLGMIVLDAAGYVPVFGYLHVLVRIFSRLFAGVSFFA